MSEYKSCDRCKKTIWHGGNCYCQSFEINHEGDIYQVFGFDEEEAATTWAEDYDSNGDNILASGEEVTISIKNAEGKVTNFVCSAEATVNYYATEA